jgi:hypothetical protein
LPPSCRLETLRLSLNLLLFQPFLWQYTFSSFLYTHVILMKHKSIVLAYLCDHKLWLRDARKKSCGFETGVCPSIRLSSRIIRFIHSFIPHFFCHTSIVFYPVTYNHSKSQWQSITPI